MVALLHDNGAHLKVTEVEPVLSARQALVRSMKTFIQELVAPQNIPERDDYAGKAEETAWGPYQSAMQAAGYPVSDADKQESLSGLKNVYDNEKLSRGDLNNE